ncbi:MAG: hydroxymethylbilane synthase, partial [Gemmatimonadetes bacterium]|nr:hydroxymethylbilane synthase [Gemmatimonadota bacterium]NIR41576.1 hydroxymethylbilane synthase [Actinomycetota bacterium]NIS36610.1 hydroxymethylbilane synthase [Actinomycetota bacterium]NIT98806.1 hydroxymethylbilane synthase [Actinomycetota bacterium]NIU71105.1 hydroxymethylbilane synthase [Actinomycetota bacterium]
MTELRLATRASALAVAQSEWVAARLEETHPDIRVRLVEITTAGDADRTTSVVALTEVGAFVRAVQQAVLRGEADVAVHSCKDLPVAGPEALEAFYPAREVPWDVLCGSTLQGLRRGARVGTGSPRRKAQLLALR